MKRRVKEIFHSLQGEGYHTGTPAVFVRFSGCNLRCSFCDTDHAAGREMTDDEIIAEVGRWDAPLIVLTGGEPAMHIDADFVRRLKQLTGRTLAIETNGTLPLPDGLDWITLSPKLTEGAQVVADRADEIKVVDLGQDLTPYLQLPCRRPETPLFLQPCFVDDPVQRQKNIESTVRRVLENPVWRLSLQTHRLLNIP